MVYLDLECGKLLMLDYVGQIVGEDRGREVQKG